MLLLGCGLGDPAAAAERIVVRAGPLSQTIELADLEWFARTGNVPDTLRLYEPFLTPQLRQALKNGLVLNPDMSDRILDDLLLSANGEQLLNTLSAIAPNLSLPQLRQAIRLAASQFEGLTLLTIIRAIPQDTLEINLTAAISLLGQLNLSWLETQTIAESLANDLPPTDAGQPFSPDFDPATPGDRRVQHRDLRLQDEDRDRTIPVDIYWGNDTAPGPLTVMSHGFAADRRFFTYLAEHLASHGFTVVAVEHPGSNVSAIARLLAPEPDLTQAPSRILPASEFLDRPQDISFVLDELAELNESSLTLQGRLNTEEVMFLGHSLGGYTGLALAGAELDLRGLEDFCTDLSPAGLSPADWLQCAALDLDLPSQTADLSDPRLVKLVVMNPLTGHLFGEAGLSNITLPTLMLTSTNDRITPSSQQQLRPFAQLSGSRYLIAVIGGTHLSVGDPTNLNPAMTELPLMAELEGDDTENLRYFLRGVVLSFLHQGDTPEGERYAPFLSSAYAESLSTPKLPLRFTTELPPNLLSWAERRQALVNRSLLGRTSGLVQLELQQASRRFVRMPGQMLAYLRTVPSALVILQSGWGGFTRE